MKQHDKKNERIKIMYDPKESFVFYTDEQINRLQAYIEENFTLDSTSRHLIANILQFVASQVNDNNIILDLLTTLLDPIGITSEEIIHAVMLTDQIKTEMTSELGVNLKNSAENTSRTIDNIGVEIVKKMIAAQEKQKMK